MDYDDDDGPMDEGAPPVIGAVRVWKDPTDSMPPTAEERARFNIPDAPPPRPASAPLAAAAPEEDKRVSVLAALVAKFPEFNAEWPAKTQDAWFDAFKRLMDAGLK
jgi:hypothetical protein